MQHVLRYVLALTTGATLFSAPTAQAADTRAPTAPTNVRVSEVTPTTVQLRFSESTDDVQVAGYNVRGGPHLVDGTNGYAFVQLLEPGETYTFTVSAYDTSSNESAPSAPVTVTLPEFEPPRNVRVTSQSRDVVSLAWDESPNLPSSPSHHVSYHVSVDGKLELVTGARTATVRHLAAGRHRITVRAFDWREELTPDSAPAEVTIAATSDRTPPTVPSGLTVTFDRDWCLYDAAWSASRDDVDQPSALAYDLLARDRLTGELYVARYDLRATSIDNFSFEVAGVRAVDSSGNASQAATPG